ncbi:hypothetical protein PAMC26510_14590 [Caballeronia sordidicola]|uniref:Uncharacterized protein n=1 Tax=Caballeronia sordidicola TaxID=196367 RepID=A0A242MUV6_CABSO|nr:hypothetical protein PAMC26510_14590 [Caballeronia sordidicola]
MAFVHCIVGMRASNSVCFLDVVEAAENRAAYPGRGPYEAAGRAMRTGTPVPHTKTPLARRRCTSTVNERQLRGFGSGVSAQVKES